MAVPSSPTIASATPDAQSRTVTLTWDEVVGATSYNVYQDGAFVANVLAPLLTYPVVRSTPSPPAQNEAVGGTFEYTLTAENDDGESDASDSVSVYLPPRFEGDALNLRVRVLTI